MVVTNSRQARDERPRQGSAERYAPACRSRTADGEPVLQTRPLRVLLIASEGPPVRSGIARMIAVLRDHLTARGHTVDIVAYPALPRLTIGEVRFTGLLLRLHRLARRLDEYDVVHLHGAAPTLSDLFLSAARRGGRRPLLVYTHHFDVHGQWGSVLSTAYNRAHHRLSGRADEVVTTTHDYAMRMRVAGHEHVSVIPQGVDLARFQSDAPKTGPFTVLFVGQYRPYKGVRVLLDAMQQVAGARLLLAGSGPEEAIYRRLAASLDIPAEFHDVDDGGLRRLYEQAHIVVLPSVSPIEAFGLVLLEGMAAGCVPVASDLLGVREVVGQVGFTVPVGNAAALADVLRQLRDDRMLLAARACAARERATHFSWERTIGEYERLYADLIAVRALHGRLRRTSGHDRAWQAFVRAIATDHAADMAQVFAGSRGGTLQPVAMAGRPAIRNGHEPDALRELVVRYAVETAEPVLVSAERRPWPLADQLDDMTGSAITAPLMAGGRAVGALLVERAEAFDRRDLDALVRLARHTAPALATRGSPGRREVCN